MKNMFARLVICCGFIVSFNTLASIEETEIFNDFVNGMVEKHQFDATELKQLFQSVEIKQNIIKTMQRPAEGMPWYKYRKIFMTDSRTEGGVKFWQENEVALTEVELKVGIPAEIIVAIIGVETLYGENTGHHRVIDALSTLAFAYPKRSRFFLEELESFLILCREEKMNPLEPTGSYAGAMGIPQFMPSSYRAYAADFENDEKRDIWNNPADAIASVANYFAKHHWHKGEAITFPVTTEGDAYQQALTKGLEPDMNWAQLQSLSINTEQVLSADERVKLLTYQQETGNDLWVGLHNFYVITRYNHSPLYAMAVYQLSDAIYKKKHKNSQEKNDAEEQTSINK
ncbi:MAG: lytic murein transglycosylase B [Methylococcales bacterium]|nr:lytic murein transglycosylase B [Methylococcales bacterium]MCK5478597.1 lytic murein transglycosylase B [Methylococcales bacterium]